MRAKRDDVCSTTAHELTLLGVPRIRMSWLNQERFQCILQRGRLREANNSRGGNHVNFRAKSARRHAQHLQARGRACSNLLSQRANVCIWVLPTAAIIYFSGPWAEGGETVRSCGL
jgi:hypothetical protein